MSATLPDGITAHQLRHRFATAAYAHQRDLRAVQELLGHASPATTARYTAVPDRAKFDAVMAAGPQAA
jgi:site-specific recombinase XerD